MNEKTRYLLLNEDKLVFGDLSTFDQEIFEEVYNGIGNIQYLTSSCLWSTVSGDPLWSYNDTYRLNPKDPRFNEVGEVEQLEKRVAELEKQVELLKHGDDEVTFKIGDRFIVDNAYHDYEYMLIPDMDGYIIMWNITTGFPFNNRKTTVGDYNLITVSELYAIGGTFFTFSKVDVV
jgi:hypothetical protein